MDPNKHHTAAGSNEMQTEGFTIPEAPSTTGQATHEDIVVIAVDGSKQSDMAFEWYMDHLHKKSNNVLLVHGLEVPSMPTRESWDHQMHAGVTKRQELQDKYQNKFKELGIHGKFISDFEKPGEFIVNVAIREKANYIVMGTRGLGKVRRTIMGSVSDYVVHHAHCPVVVSRKA